MKHDQVINRTIVVASLVLFPLLLPAMTIGAEPQKGTRSSQERGLEQIADGSAEDTLKACLARIPADATAGQLLLAQQNCKQVEVDRTQQDKVYRF